MPTDNAALLHYFLQDDLYLLKQDKALYAGIDKQPIVETQKPHFNYLGGNINKFLIVVSYTTDEHMAEAHLKALESTLARKNLSINDVAILNIDKHRQYDHEQVLEHFAVERLLILGPEAMPENIALPGLNVIESKPKHRQLYTHSFSEMIADRDKARAFWDQMKNF